MNFIRRSRQLHLDVPNPNVFRRIVEGFLENSEKAKRNVRRQRTGQIVGSEVNLSVLLLGEFLAEASHGGRYAQIFQFCRVQLVREGLDIGCYRARLPLKFAHTAADFRRIGKLLAELVQLYGHQCETLSEVVVKLSCDPGALLLLCFKFPLKTE